MSEIEGDVVVSEVVAVQKLGLLWYLKTVG